MLTEAVIWVVDDDINNFTVIETYLLGEGYTLQHIASGEETIKALESEIIPDVILLDLMMPGVNGLEVCQRLKANPSWQTIPVIFITALSARESLAKCFAAGADDFLNKPINRTELQARVRSMLRLSTQYQAVQDLNAQLHDTNRRLADLNQHLEVQVKQRTADLEWTLFHDSLTQLPNRHYLLQQIQSLLQKKNPSRSFYFVLFYLDCDQFQLVNDSLGYLTGDRVLQELADRLRNILSPKDTLARISADGFCILSQQPQTQEDVQTLANNLLGIFQKPFVIDYYTVFLTACLGVVKVDKSYVQADEPLRNANTALYKAKRQGQGSCVFFETHMHRATLNRLQMESDLRKGLEREEFVVYYQPILNIKTRQPVGFEALVRWQHPTRGLIPPGEFIACAEDSGLIIPMGLSVLQQACQQVKTWEEQGFKSLVMSVNLSARQLTHPTLLADIEAVLSRTHLMPEFLQLEITESYLVENYQVAVHLTQQLRSRNIQISLDDFGTGYSSLSYLTRFPVSNLKLDRCFIQNLNTSVEDKAVVKAMIAMGQALGIHVTGEGIETESQVSQLLEVQCQYGQGYYFSRPMRPEKATNWLTKRYSPIVR